MIRVGITEAPQVPNASPRGSLRGAFPSFYRGLQSYTTRDEPSGGPSAETRHVVRSVVSVQDAPRRVMTMAARDGAAPLSERFTAMGGRYASDDTWLVGTALRAYRERHGLSEAQLAAHLRISTEALGWLGMRTRPDSTAPTFTREVQRLADAFRCDAVLLAAILSG